MIDWNNFKDNVFVINLKSDTDKWETMQTNFGEQNIKLNRVDAIYGKTLNPVDREKNTTTMCRYFCPDSAVGCGMSHMKVWRYIVENSIEYAVVLEDDVTPIDDFISRFNKVIKEVPDDWDIFYLYCLGVESTPEGLETFVSQIGGGEKITENIFRPGYPLSTAGYCLNLEGAKRLLNATHGKVSYHIDAQIASNISEGNINAYGVYPYMLSSEYEESETVDGDSFTANTLFNFRTHENQPKLSWYLQAKGFKS